MPKRLRTLGSLGQEEGSTCEVGVLTLPTSSSSVGTTEEPQVEKGREEEVVVEEEPTAAARPTKQSRKGGAELTTSSRGHAHALQLGPDVLAQIATHTHALDAEVNDLLNREIPAQLRELEHELRRAAEGELSVAEKQRVASQCCQKVTHTLDVVNHWIAMHQERLECGNEFGSEVQAAVSGSVGRDISLTLDRKDQLHSLLFDTVNLGVPKLAALQPTEPYRALHASLRADFAASYARLLRSCRRTYLRVLHTLASNRGALVDPKNRRGLQSSSEGIMDGSSGSSSSGSSIFYM